MYIFRLFQANDPATAIDARLLAEGALTVGRDPESDWVMIDPTCEISREHLTVRIAGNDLVLHCKGSNGVFDDVRDVRFPNGTDLPLAVPAALRLGPYRLVADHAPQAALNDLRDVSGTLLMSLPTVDRPDAHAEWDEPVPVSTMTAGTMFEAFCHGAGIDPSQFSSEDPAIILQRAGAIYRHMVCGVSDLVAERERVRGHFRLAKTTIGGADNNPFKWAPTQRLAIDLLVPTEKSFLSGADAVEASFRDIKSHWLATHRGFQNSVRTAVATFAPDSIEKATEGQNSLLKSKSTVQWHESCRRHAQLADELEGAPGTLDNAFVSAYDGGQIDCFGNLT